MQSKWYAFTMYIVNHHFLVFPVQSRHEERQQQNWSRHCEF